MTTYIFKIITLLGGLALFLLIEDEAVFQDLGWSSKLNTDMEFLKHLFDAGRVAADKWLEKNYDKIGKETTASVAEEFV